MFLSVCALISEVMEAMDSLSSRLLLCTEEGRPASTASEQLEMLESDEFEDCRNILYVEVCRESGLGQILKFGSFQIVVQLILVLIGL